MPRHLPDRRNVSPFSREQHLALIIALVSLAVLWLLSMAGGTEAAASAKRKAPKPAQENWYSMQLNGAHSGFLFLREAPQPDKSDPGRRAIDIQVSITFVRDKVHTPISFLANGFMNGEGGLHSLKGRLYASAMPTQFELRTADGKYLLTLDNAGQKQEMELPMDSALFADEHLMERIGETKFEVGVPVRLELTPGVGTSVTYEGRKPLPGKTAPEYPVYTVRPEILGDMPTRYWLHDDGENFARMEQNMFGLQLAFESCSRAEALRPVETTGNTDLFQASIQRQEIVLPPAGHIERVTFRVRSSWDGVLPPFPQLPGRQEVTQADSNATITVRRKPLPESYPLAKLKQDLTPELKAYLTTTSQFQVSSPQVMELLSTLEFDRNDTVLTTRKLRRWVYQNIAKSMDVGFASAQEVLELRKGDCTEHSVLLVTLLRAEGIPARTASGLVYSDRDKGFVGHMWIEVWLGDWYPLDATLDMRKSDPLYLTNNLSSSSTDSETILREYLQAGSLTVGTMISVEDYVLRAEPEEEQDLATPLLNILQEKKE